MKNKKGFTLIELLAVIVILTIIALIAVPTIMNVLNKANKSAFKDTAYGIISAGELYFAEQQLELNGMTEDAEFEFPNNIGTLQVKGNVPDGTKLQVNTNGETALAMSNGRYCVTKGYTDNDITIVEEYTNCDIPTDTKTLADLAVVSADLNVDSVAACLTDGTNCAVGTAFAVKVNDTDTYKFRVLKDEENVVTLIMSSNLYAEGNTTEPDVAWLSQADYEAAGGTAWDDWTGNNTYGPMTALKVLKERTADWTNLEEYSYELSYGPVYVYDAGGNTTEVEDTYSGEYVQNVRARLPRRSDIIGGDIGCTEYDTTCPDWIYEGLEGTGDDNTIGYWLSDASSVDSDFAWSVSCDGYVGDDYANVASVANGGVRPVITLTK